MSFSSQLSDLDQISKTEDRIKAYGDLIGKIFSDKDRGKSEKLLEHILDDSFPTVISQEIMTIFAKSFSSLPNNSVLEIGMMSLDMIKSKLNLLELQDSLIRKEVAKVLHIKKEYSQSAKCLMEIKLKNTMRSVSPYEQAETYITIAENWFYDDDAVNAETYLNMATHVILDVEDEDLNIRYRYCKAKVFDSKRKFILASQAYNELATHEGGKIDESN